MRRKAPRFFALRLRGHQHWAWPSVTAGAVCRAKPAHIIVGYSTGGATETAARIIAVHLQMRPGQHLILGNHTRMVSDIAYELEVVAATPAGGYIPPMTTTLMIMYGHLQRTGVRCGHEFRTRSQAATWTPRAFGASGHDRGQCQATHRPGGEGTGRTHSRLHGRGPAQRMAGIRITHVPCGGGSNPMTSPVGDHRHVLHDRIQRCAARAGTKVSLVGVADSRRLSGLPDVATPAPASSPEMSADSWIGSLIPASTPSDGANNLCTATPA